MINLIETNWKWFFASLILGSIFKYFGNLDFFIIFMFAFIIAKLIEIQSYYLDK